MVAIALGVATTVAVAWTAAFLDWPWSAGNVGWLTHEGITTEFVIESSTWSTVIEWPKTRHANVIPELLLSAPLPAWAALRSEVMASSESTRRLFKEMPAKRSEVATGFPMRALAADFSRVVVEYEMGHWSRRSGIPLQQAPNWPFYPRTLPTRVLPFGFAINATLFALAWWLLLFAFPTTRQFLRERRGACLKCGYGPLPSPDARCSECGGER